MSKPLAVFGTWMIVFTGAYINLTGLGFGVLGAGFLSLVTAEIVSALYLTFIWSDETEEGLEGEE